MADIEKNPGFIPEMKNPWKTIRELSATGFPGTMVLNIIRESQPQTFTSLKKKTALPKGTLKDILDKLINSKLVAQEAGDITLTNYAVVLLGVFDNLNNEMRKMLIEEGMSSKELARMADDGSLVKVLLQRVLKSKQ